MVIKCEKKTIEESLGQRKLNIRGNKETRAMRPWKEGPGWQGSQQTLFLSCPLHFFSNTQVERPHRTQGLEGAKEKTVSGKQENKAARLQAPVTGGTCASQVGRGGESLKLQLWKTTSVEV